MRVIDVRLIVEDAYTAADIAAELLEETPGVYGAVPLKNWGSYFGRRVVEPDMSEAKFFQGDRDVEAALRVGWVTRA